MFGLVLNTPLWTFNIFKKNIDDEIRWKIMKFLRFYLKKNKITNVSIKDKSWTVLKKTLWKRDPNTISSAYSKILEMLFL